MHANTLTILLENVQYLYIRGYSYIDAKIFKFGLGQTMQYSYMHNACIYICCMQETCMPFLYMVFACMNECLYSYSRSTNGYGKVTS